MLHCSGTLLGTQVGAVFSHRERKLWLALVLADGAAAAVVACANVWTVRTGWPLAQPTSASEWGVWYGVNPAAALLAGWLAGRRGARAAGVALWVWVGAMFLLGSALGAWTDVGFAAVGPVWRESPLWLTPVYLGALGATGALGARLGRAARRKAQLVA